jgi:hypothetical protein
LAGFAAKIRQSIRHFREIVHSPNKKIAAHFQRCVQRQIYNVRKQLTRKQLDAVKLGDSFGALTSFFEKNDFRELVAKHNDPADSYHPPCQRFDFVIIGGEVTAERDLLRLNFSSAWMLANFSPRYRRGLGFQLNADATSNFCRASVDLVEIGVNSIPCQNNVPCLSLIPKGTESEKLFQLTWDDLLNAIMHLCCVKHRRSSDCLTCNKPFF